LKFLDYVFTFFEMPLQKKRKKSRFFLDFQKNLKTYSRTMAVIANYVVVAL